MRKNKGMIYVFVGKGKGKTSAALGVAVRMLLLKKTVEWIAWYKQKSWKTAEMSLPRFFPKKLKMHWTGRGFFGGPLDKDTPERHKNAAMKALFIAKSKLEKNKESKKRVDLLVLDEVLRAIDDELLEMKDVLEVIKLRGKTHLILTGDVCLRQIEKEADLITKMEKIKHPFDKGLLAVSGLDF